MTPPADLPALADALQGELLADDLVRTVYSTDASEYQERPLAVAFPKTDADVATIIRYAASHGVGIIPRAAGTSLAGQVVGDGIVVDVGRHLNRILALDVERRRVRVQPGVVRNELNRYLAPHGLFFGPETSTAGWAMIGGMVGNNSCGANSIAYGTTRDHLMSARGFLADGMEVTFGPLDAAGFHAACGEDAGPQSRLYRAIGGMLGSEGNRRLIRESFPRPEVSRRNTGYALDALMDADCFDPSSRRPFNFCRLLAGSEGTLFFGVEFELELVPLPPPAALLCVHCDSVDEALRATVVVMRDLAAVGPRPTACELIDRKILACTRDNLEQARNREFVVGDPGAILVVELRDADRERLDRQLDVVESALRAAGLGIAFPRLHGADGDRVWELRRAGQGLVNNLPGDARPREVIEDTAVAVEDLPAYIADVDRLLAGKYGVDCVHYAHAGAGELHLRPLFDLHSPDGLRMFRDVATDVAHLVKAYRGSLSGEHGDGRLRGEFIRTMLGDDCYRLIEQVKQTFDPHGILNPGKIVGTPPMDTGLRVDPTAGRPAHETVFRFAEAGGILRAAEKCTGVGQCRKTHLVGGTMCPSYMATRDERHTTRARANVLRQALADPATADPWTRPELAAVMDLCLSCKACKSECPSNVDMTRLKAEWEHQRHEREGVPFRSRMIAGSAVALRWAARCGWLSRLALAAPGVSGAVKRLLGFAAGRSLPTLHGITLAEWLRRRGPRQSAAPHGRVHLFCDEFTDTIDVPAGIAAVELLEALGYEVVVPRHVDSGRAHFSTGLLRSARDLATRNVELLSPVVTDEAPLVGIEPSAILGFRDEYPDIVPARLAAESRVLAGRALLVEEFLAREAARGRVTSASFTTRPRRVLLHGHCHQKALASMAPTIEMLRLPENYSVEPIPSGCCGMAGSFGYEAEHHDLSMQIGELVLLPAVRAAPPDAILAASGTSCRHQILDGTGRKARHPVEVLRDALAARP
ncbi:MAG: FAD-binding and (Fe-S)-binding domain-containing protein [Pirellulales bacterium]